MPNKGHDGVSEIILSEQERHRRKISVAFPLSVCLFSLTHTHSRTQMQTVLPPLWLKCQQGKLEMSNSFKVWNRLLLIYVRLWIWQIDSWGKASGKFARQLLLFFFLFWIMIMIIYLYRFYQTQLSVVIEVASPLGKCSFFHPLICSFSSLDFHPVNKSASQREKRRSDYSILTCWSRLRCFLQLQYP